MKRPGFVLSAITVAGMIFVGAVTVAVASEGRGHGFSRQGFGAHGFSAHGINVPQMAEHLIRFLDLDDAQRDEVRRIADDAQPELRALSDAMRDSHSVLREMAEADVLDTGALRAAADRQGDLVSDMIVIGAGVMTEVRAVLTPEQLEKVEARLSGHGQGHRFGRRR